MRTPAVDCQTTFDARCLVFHATDAEIEADALASQHRIEVMLEEQHAEAAWWEGVEQQEALWRAQAEWAARLFTPTETPPATYVFAPLRVVPRRWHGRR